MGRNKRKYKKNCAFSFKRKRAAWNKRKDKAMTLDTQVNLAESGKGSFYIRLYHFIYKDSFYILYYVKHNVHCI